MEYFDCGSGGPGDSCMSGMVASKRGCYVYAREYESAMREKDAEIARLNTEAEIGSFLMSEIKAMCEAAGIDMSGTPPMMYPEAIASLIRKEIKDLDAENSRMKMHAKRAYEYGRNNAEVLEKRLHHCAAACGAPGDPRDVLRNVLAIAQGDDGE